MITSENGGGGSAVAASRLVQAAMEFDRIQLLFGPDPRSYLPIVADAARRARGPVVELGCGTGGAIAALRSEVEPPSRLVGIEIDPVLRALAESVHAVVPSPIDIRSSTWAASHCPAVVLAVRTLHYLGAAEVARLYRTLAAHMPPGGTVVVADRLGPPSEPSAQGSIERWKRWWADVARMPEVGACFAARAQIGHSDGNAMSAAEHESAFRAAGFCDVDIVASGPHTRDAVIVARLTGA